MWIYLKFIIGLFAFILVGCAAQSDEPYTPSIAALKPNEALVMDLSACHWGCTEGEVKFENNTASMGPHSLSLTPLEIDQLDRYFLRGRDLDTEYRCSLPIHISFTQKKGVQVLNQTDTQIYPCFFGEDDVIIPIDLVTHLNKRPDEIPYWRESSEEPILTIED